MALQFDSDFCTLDMRSSIYLCKEYALHKIVGNAKCYENCFAFAPIWTRFVLSLRRRRSAVLQFHFNQNHHPRDENHIGFPAEQNYVHSRWPRGLNDAFSNLIYAECLKRSWA